MCEYYCQDCCLPVNDYLNHNADHWLIKTQKQKYEVTKANGKIIQTNDAKKIVDWYFE